jgi:hypothetical protein
LPGQAGRQVQRRQRPGIGDQLQSAGEPAAAVVVHRGVSAGLGVELLNGARDVVGAVLEQAPAQHPARARQRGVEFQGLDLLQFGESAVAAVLGCAGPDQLDHLIRAWAPQQRQATVELVLVIRAPCPVDDLARCPVDALAAVGRWQQRQPGPGDQAQARVELPAGLGEQVLHVVAVEPVRDVDQGLKADPVAQSVDTQQAITEQRVDLAPRTPVQVRLEFPAAGGLILITVELGEQKSA